MVQVEYRIIVPNATNVSLGVGAAAQQELSGQQ